jgi:hypothetical protein
MEYEEKWRAEINRKQEQIDKAKAALLAKGVRLKVAACGCCDSPWVQIEIDGAEIAKIEGQNIDMFEEDA